MLWNVFVPHNFKYWALLEITLTLLLAMIQLVQGLKHQPAGILAMVAFIVVSVLRFVLAQAIEIKLRVYQYQNVPKPRVGKYQTWKLVLGILTCMVIVAMALLKIDPAIIICCLVVEMNLNRFAKELMLTV